MLPKREAEDTLFKIASLLAPRSIQDVPVLPFFPLAVASSFSSSLFCLFSLTLQHLFFYVIVFRAFCERVESSSAKKTMNNFCNARVNSIVFYVNLKNMRITLGTH